MAYQQLLLAKEKGIGKITLNRPEKRNALGLELAAEITQAFQEVSPDPSIKVVILTGAGKSFSSGGELTQLYKMLELNPIEIKEKIYSVFQGMVRAVDNCPKPVIAAVNGPAVGAGFELCLNCDIRIASRDASFSEYFVRLATVPGMGGMHHLPRLLGLGKAYELALTGDFITAEEAERIGLVNRVVPAQELEAEVNKLASRLADGPTKTIEMIKLGIKKGLNMDLAGALEFAAFLQSAAFKTEDVREGIIAGMEKRQPRFQGR